MLKRFQSRFCVCPHLPEVVAVVPFASFQAVEKHLIDSSSEFLCNLSLLLDVIGSDNSLMFQCRKRFQGHVEAAIDSGQRIVSPSFHMPILETYYSRFVLDILRLMFMECPHRSENGSAQGFGKDRKSV